MSRFAPVLIFTTLLAACDPVAEQQSPPPPPTEPAGQAAPDQSGPTGETPDPNPQTPSASATPSPKVKEQRANILWQEARRDFAAQNAADPDDNLVSIATAGERPPPVPVLLPTGGPVTVATGGAGPRFKQTDDGYYAVYPYENFDVIVNGTNEIVGERPAGARDETPKFTATAAGAQVALSRYGADYLVEFECYEINPRTGTCIEEDEAMQIANSLVIRGTR